MYQLRFLKYFLISLLFVTINLNAQKIEFDAPEQNILKQSEIYITSSTIDFSDINKSTDFISNELEHLNLGFVRDTSVWVKVTFHNSSTTKLSKILEIKNPLLEEVVLYDKNGVINIRGMLYIQKYQTTINPSFKITLHPNEISTYYLHISNKTTALRFGLFLKNKDIFIHDDYVQQTLMIVFLGIIISLFIYNVFLYYFTNKKAYIYYALYLITLLLQQITYLGISQLYFPNTLVDIDNLSVVLKVNVMYIMAAIFAKSFLQTLRYSAIDKIYNIIIIIAIIEIPLFGTQYFYYPEVGILTGLTFVIFNIYAGVRIYLKGYKPARFFVIGWAILVIGFILMIFDGLGIISVMHKYPNLIMCLTAIEAMVLSLAFVDYHKVFTQEKDKSNTDLLHALENSKSIIEQEIISQTKELVAAVESKKILLKELQHRTKNNLQLIISLVRMQADNSGEVIKTKFSKLEGRIRAIAKTHELLYLKDDLEHISMDDYIEQLCSDIQDGFSSKDIRFIIETRGVYMPFREASYVGLIINELVTNSIKYASCANIAIVIDMSRNQRNYQLVIKDNGKGYDLTKLKTDGMGLTLVRALVEDQLDGKMVMKNNNGVKYMIEYKL